MHTMRVSSMQQGRCLRVSPASNRVSLNRAAAGYSRQRQQLIVRAHGTAVRDPTATQGFVGEMRKVAMKLHTKDQAPKEGERPAQTPVQKWEPTREGYLRFLVESLAVYDALEGIVDEHDVFTRLRATGLERSEGLRKDIQWLSETYGLEVPTAAEDGPGAEYAALLRSLSASDPAAFMCHYYNTYFAHTAGGFMIGSKVAGSVLDGAALAFYQYPGGDHKPLLTGVRESINALAEGWDEEQKQRCLLETEKAFQYSGKLLRLIIS